MGSLCETRNVCPLKAGLAHDPPRKFYENFVHCAFGGVIIFTKGSVTPKIQNNSSLLGKMSLFFRVPGKT